MDKTYTMKKERKGRSDLILRNVAEENIDIFSKAGFKLVTTQKNKSEDNKSTNRKEFER